MRWVVVSSNRSSSDDAMMPDVVAVADDVHDDVQVLCSSVNRPAVEAVLIANIGCTRMNSAVKTVRYQMIRCVHHVLS